MVLIMKENTLDVQKNKAMFVTRVDIQKYNWNAAVKGKHHNVRNRNNAQLFGGIFANLFQERIDVAKTKYENAAPRKQGPRDIGRIKGWVGGDDEYGLPDENGVSFLEERGQGGHGRRQSWSFMPREKKLGPRDIGTTHGWKGAKYDIKEDGGDFLSDKLGSRNKDYENVTKEKKLGPRDVGTVHGWKGTHYDVDNKNGDFLNEKVGKKRNSAELVIPEKKLGPRDLGKIKGWKGMKFDPTKEELEKKRKKEEEERLKMDQIKQELKKQGPREMGKVKGYKGTKYDLEKEERLKRQKKKKKQNYDNNLLIKN